MDEAEKVKSGGCNASVIQRRIPLVEPLDGSKACATCCTLVNTALAKRGLEKTAERVFFEDIERAS